MLNAYNNALLDVFWDHKIKFMLFLVFTVIAFTYVPSLIDLQEDLMKQKTHKSQYLNQKELAQRHDIFDIILDVRSPEEYKQGHVENSVNVEYKDIISSSNGDVLENKGVTKKKIVLLYCKTGRRASLARNHMIDTLKYSPRNVYMTSENYKDIEATFENK